MSYFSNGGGLFFSRAISIGRVVELSTNIVINPPRTYDKLQVKEKPIGSAVCEILQYRQTPARTVRTSGQPLYEAGGQDGFGNVKNN